MWKTWNFCHHNSFNLALCFLLFLLLAICSAKTASASGEVYSQLEYFITIDIPSFLVGSTFYNQQISGDQTSFCGGGNTYVIKNPEPHSTSTYQNAWKGEGVLSQIGVPTYATIKNNYGSGNYLIVANSVLGCPNIRENVFGSGYVFVYIDANGNVEYQQPLYEPENVTQNIRIIEPTYGTTTATTTVDISIFYRTPFTIDERPGTYRWYEIRDAITNELEYSYTDFLATSTLESITLEEQITLATGSKYIYAGYLDQLYQPYSEVVESFFSVIDNTYFLNTGLQNPRDNVNSLTQIDCSTFDVGCQFQKALVFLFIPPSNTLDRFSNLWQNVAEKKPFGYVTVTIKQLGSLNDGGDPTFSLGTIPFMDTIFTPIKTLLAGILWAVFAINFYHRRLVHLDI